MSDSERTTDADAAEQSQRFRNEPGEDGDSDGQEQLTQTTAGGRNNLQTQSRAGGRETFDASVHAIRQIPVKVGGLFGVVAFVVGFTTTYFLFELDGGMVVADTDEATTVDAVGWLFYNAHFSDTRESFAVNGESRTQSFSLISDVSTEFPEFLFHLVPVLALIGMGFLIVWFHDVEYGGTAVLTGSSVVLGYFPVAIVGRELFDVTMREETISGEITYSVAPELWTSILYVGLLYPLLLGGVGGLLAQYFRSR